MPFVIGTSGYSFKDWAGTFYPAGTPAGRMFEQYVKHFRMVELNFTFYSMPGRSSFDNMLRLAPESFEFWIKVNREISHEGKLQSILPFLAALEPIRSAGKLAGTILQFPQSFKRTVAARKFLADAIDRLTGPVGTAREPTTLAVEFRDASWEQPAVFDGLRQRNVAVVVPDAPPQRGLFRPAPTATADIGYLRLHSRDAAKWRQGVAARYDYSYSQDELLDIARQWKPIAGQTRKTYVLFNNCHRGQAGMNAESFAKIVSAM